MKKSILIIITAVLLLFTACSNSSNTDTKNANQPTSTPIVSTAATTTIDVKNSNVSVVENKTDLIGTWERTGDIYEGLQVKVEKQGDKYTSSILRLDNGNQLVYLTVGAEKWKEITKKQDDLWTIKDSGVDKNKKELLYDMDIKLSDDGSKLELSDIGTDGKEVGGKQVWKRIE